MKNYKLKKTSKFFLIILITFCTLTLIFLGGREIKELFTTKETKTFEIKTDRTALSQSFIYANNIVRTHTISYNAKINNNAQQVKDNFQNLANRYKNINGVVVTEQYNESDVLLKIDIDYKKANIEKLKNIPDLKDFFDNSNSVNIVRITKVLINQGYSEKINT